MNTFAIMLLAIATCFAAGTALWIALSLLDSQRRLQQKKASVLRAHLVAQLHAIRETVVPRGRALDVLQKEIYEPLQYLWVQADLLDPAELHAINRCGSTLLALRHKPSLNQTQARLARSVIDETCSVLIRSEETPHEQDQQWSMVRGFAKRLPGFASIEMNGASQRRQPCASNEIGVLKS